jgi:hypothetical protein
MIFLVGNSLANAAVTSKNGQYKTVEWTDLIPKDKPDAQIKPPSYDTDVEGGAVEDQIKIQIQQAIIKANKNIYPEALFSTRVISEMNGQAIRIAGFIVPLLFKEDQIVTQFFFVPFFGACIHVPPPPPNQIIFVDYPSGLKLENLDEPFWISGVLKISLTENEVATSAYSMDMSAFKTYIE